MTALRVFVGPLALTLTMAIAMAGRFGLAEYVVASFPLFYHILEMREELLELRVLKRQLAHLKLSGLVAAQV